MKNINLNLVNISITLILIFAGLVIGMIPNEEKHFITEKGLDCVMFNLFSSPSCNWYRLNYLTDYGQEPVAIDPDPGS